MQILKVLSKASVWIGIILALSVCSLSVVSQDSDDTGAEDVIEGEEEDEASVETDEATESDMRASELTRLDGEREEEVEAASALKPSPDAETFLLFLSSASQEFPAGKPVRLLIGFKNKGSQSFVVDSMDAAFRYPQDYSYYIQNFTGYQYHQTVEPNLDATFEYTFVPSDSFSARAFGLTVNLNYHDSEDNVFQDALFNSTINVTEPDEGFDGETFFLYIFLAAVLVLIFVGLHQLFNTYGKKRLISRSRPTVEMGTQNNKADVDYNWLPDSLLNDISRSPKPDKAAKASPHQRKMKSQSGDAS